GDEAALGRLTDEMKQIEGEEGTVWRAARAAQLIRTAAERKDAHGLEEAEALLAPVAARRPKWSRVSLCRARIADLRGKPAEALPHYLRALRLGERSPLVVGRTVELLYERRRYAEAYAVSRRLPAEAPLSGNLQRVLAEISLQAGSDKGRALQQAR